jgi:hypothetical protein
MPDMTRLRGFLRMKLDPTDYATACSMLDGGIDPGEIAGDEPPYFPGRPRPGGAMDAMPRGDRSTIRAVQGIREAETAVAPYVGAIAGLDSAASTYAAAIRRLGHSTAGVPAAAMEAVFRGYTGQLTRAAAATSAAAADARLAARFPGIDRLRA